jgi:hypothetical protein
MSGWGQERRIRSLFNISALPPRNRRSSGHHFASLGADFVAKVVDGLAEQ